MLRPFSAFGSAPVSRRPGAAAVAAGLVLLVLGACGANNRGGGSSGLTPTAPSVRPRELSGITAAAPRTPIRVGQTIGPLAAYGLYDDSTTGTVSAAWTSSDPAVAEFDEEGRVTGVAPGTATFVATFESHEATVVFDVVEPNPRYTEDQPDDIEGPQIHVVYVVPSDGEDQNLDRWGAIATSVRAIQNWVGEDIDRSLRFDTRDGELDVTFHRTSFTQPVGGDGEEGGEGEESGEGEEDEEGGEGEESGEGEEDEEGEEGGEGEEDEDGEEGEDGEDGEEGEEGEEGGEGEEGEEGGEGEAEGPRLVLALLEDFEQARGLHPDKIYAFYYSGGATGICGDADPAGRAAAVFIAADSCSSAVPGADPEVASTYEAVMLHELLHTLGAVPECALNPDSPGGFHVGDDPLDVMYRGVERDTGDQMVIDASRDDYFGHGRAECADTAGSPYWAPPGATRARRGFGTAVRIPPEDRPLRCGVGLN